MKTLELDDAVSLTERNYRIYEDKNPMKNLSTFEFSTIRTLLNEVSVDTLLASLADAYGSNGKTLKSLLSLGVLYNAEYFIVRLIGNPLFEFPLEYLQAFLRIARGLIDKDDFGNAQLLVAYLSARIANNLKIKVLELRLYMQADEGEKIDQIFSGLSDQDYLMELSLANLRIDYLCTRKEFDEVSCFIRSFKSPEYLPSFLLGRMIQFYITIGDLANGRALLQYWLRQNFCYYSQFDTLFRLIEGRDSALDVIAQIERIDGWYRYPDLIACRNAIRLHFCQPILDDKIEMRDTVTQPDSDIFTSKNAILLCVDKNYRIPALVTILGIIREIIPCSSKPVIALFLPESEIEFWRKISLHLSSFPEFPSFSLIPENLHEIPKSREHFGFDTNKSLPVMTYGRLFAAQILMQRGYDKLLYLDADTVVLNDVTPLFSTHQLGYPVSGVIEWKVGKIQQAIKAHHIVNGKYFNSGVMLFDLKHPATEVIVRNAIEFVLNPNIHLLFHDQCALNKAVSGHFHPLPEKYNLFYTPGMVSRKEEENVILHFIGSPKPWDIAYRGRGKKIWYNQWLRALADLEKLNLLSLVSQQVSCYAREKF
jgi:lipopolysaccharide biosynthesis glycosyltransferase